MIKIVMLTLLVRILLEQKILRKLTRIPVLLILLAVAHQFSAFRADQYMLQTADLLS